MSRSHLWSKRNPFCFVMLSRIWLFVCFGLESEFLTSFGAEVILESLPHNAYKTVTWFFQASKGRVCYSSTQHHQKSCITWAGVIWSPLPGVSRRSCLNQEADIWQCEHQEAGITEYSLKCLQSRTLFSPNWLDMLCDLTMLNHKFPSHLLFKS